ncbi:energy transducer TonB [Pseudoalteromonas luteoviolacea]|uniref:TonB C-terminal domain-containing protein n=1 Tax=Pseudoalteromonas luteoviolacea S4060-1 TaxID=1365257 RepID=A0A167J126_9GAMM|nr:TonB family protein [Pseudoalteromonas luteoviolacea]KZN60355.1 hypothetical protein N478_07300 [Pseudoalteromonas luteoviolacea S4060-1]
MSLLAGPNPTARKHARRKWVLATLAAFALHIAIAAVLMWQAPQSLTPPPASSPNAFQVSIVAASKYEPSKQPVGPEQQASTAAQPQQVAPQTPPEAQPKTAIKPIKNTQSKVKVAKPSEKPKPKEPKKETPKPTEVKSQPEEVKPAKVTTKKRLSESQTSSQASQPDSAPQKATQNTSTAHKGAHSNSHIQAQMVWKGRVQAHLERKKRYPRSAKIRAQQGAPWVKFSINRQGEVLSVSLYKASGITALDKEAIALVKRAQPLPPPPDSIEGNPITMAVPIAFFIKK